MERHGVAILVEGPSDAAIVQLLLARSGHQNEARVRLERASRADAHGVGAFHDKLVSLLETKGLLATTRRFVLVCDADDDAQATFGTMAEMLADVGLPRPDAPGVVGAGQLHRAGLPQVDVESSILMIPGPDAMNDERGNLETLLLRSLEGDARLACIANVTACWTELGVSAPQRRGNADRRQMQLWLSQFVDAKGYVNLASACDPAKVATLPWNLDHPAFAPLIAHLRAL